jgi:methylmalonyl-CoA mutase
MYVGNHRRSDAIANLPYDSLYHKDNEFGDRIAKSIVSSEKKSYFDKVNNPADGSYYRNINRSISRKSVGFIQRYRKWWFLKQLNEGVIKENQESADKEQELLIQKEIFGN